MLDVKLQFNLHYIALQNSMHPWVIAKCQHDTQNYDLDTALCMYQENVKFWKWSRYSPNLQKDVNSKTFWFFEQFVKKNMYKFSVVKNITFEILHLK